MKDPKRLAWARALPCCLFHSTDFGPCQGPVEAHHPTGAGLALKADDSKSYPLCRRHHRDRHDATGAFHDMDKATRKLWEAEMVEKYQDLYAAQVFGPG